MLAIQILLIVYFAAAFAYWLMIARAMWLVRRRVPRLIDSQPPSPARWPRLSVIIPACNEADRIEPAARTLLAEDYPDLELIFVDDRSDDSTGAIIDRLAAEDPRAKAIHIRELPEGWLGKVHALHRGFAESSGEFVLFTDADIHFAPGSLRKAVAYAAWERLDHLAALPELLHASFLVDAVILLFLRQFMAAVRPWAVSDPRSTAYIGIGAFNLVRREAFAATAGFEWLRMETADDMGVGLLMKTSGKRCGVAGARGYLSLQWYRTLGEAARGAERGWSTVLRFSLVRTAVLVLLSLLIQGSPVLALVPLAWDGLRPAGYAGLAVTAAFLASALLLRGWGRGGLWLRALATPLVSPVVAFALLRAGWLGRRRGGAMWRGTVYPSALLRAGARVKF
ncbi:MAG: glycosyltransferase family 2 protein [Planctomycetota bacterium]|nr:glycosyltransferase family 2 protein [Planctomycetota bacterium]